LIFEVPPHLAQGCLPHHNQRQGQWHRNVHDHAASNVLENACANSDEDNDCIDENHDENDVPQPWRRLLELPARASWRASDPHPPASVLEAQQSILNASGVTTKQLRHMYADFLVPRHQALAERRERERRRMFNNQYYSRKAQHNDEEIAPVVYGKLEALASLKHRMKPNYAIAKRVLEEAKSLLGYEFNKNHHQSSNINIAKQCWKARRIIDMGIGVGSASAAALVVFEHDVEWVHGIDPSRCMRECSKEFLEDITAAMATMQTQQAAQQQQQQRINPPRVTLSGSITTEKATSTFDLALLTYTATELPHVASTLAGAAILWQKLSHNGLFVMIEPGTPDGFNSIRAVRNMLLDCCPPATPNTISEFKEKDEEDADALDQCHIIAPCTHNGKCPMERYQHDHLRQKHPKTQMDYHNRDGDDDATTAAADDLGHDWDDEDESDGQDYLTSKLVVETEFLSRRFCSFVQTMSSGSHLSKGEKFSYLVAQRRVPGIGHSHDINSPAFSVEASSQNDKPRDLLASVYQANGQVDKGNQVKQDEHKRHVQDLFEAAQALESWYLDSEEDDLGLEFVQGDINRASFGRIIRAPLKNRGHVFIDYCAAPGKLIRSRVSKALDYRLAPGLFTAARKSRWGGLWPHVENCHKLSSVKTSQLRL